MKYKIALAVMTPMFLRSWVSVAEAPCPRILGVGKLSSDRVFAQPFSPQGCHIISGIDFNPTKPNLIGKGGPRLWVYRKGIYPNLTRSVLPKKAGWSWLP
jgi:hypothetical protein